MGHGRGKEGGPRMDRRDTILEIASRCFLDYGFDGTTMSEIAARLGGSKGTLWSHFSSKDELFAACVDQRSQAYRRDLETVLDPQAPLHEAIAHFCRSFIAKIRTPGALALYRLLCGAGTLDPVSRRLYFERGPGAVESMLTDFLSGHIEEGFLGGAQPLEMARFLVSLCSGMSHQRLLMGMESPEVEPADGLAERVTDLFFKLYGCVSSQTATAIQLGPMLE